MGGPILRVRLYSALSPPLPRPMTPAGPPMISGGGLTFETDYENQPQSGYRNRRDGNCPRLVLDRRACGVSLSEGSLGHARWQDRVRDRNARRDEGLQGLQRPGHGVRFLPRAGNEEQGSRHRAADAAQDAADEEAQ